MLTKGTRIIKCLSAPGDGHQDGAKGKILQLEEVLAETIKTHKKDSTVILPPEGHVLEGVYCIEWDDMEGLPVWISDYRIKEDK